MPASRATAPCARWRATSWDEVLDTNLGGCFNMCKAVWDGMLERSFGRIVNIGSINGQAGQYGQVNYAAAKSGIHGFTKALAQEGAPKGITVNAIAPGYIDTDMVAAVPAERAGKDRRAHSRGPLGQGERNRARRRSSWSPTTRASSPDRRCRSTAASICIELDLSWPDLFGPSIRRVSTRRMSSS